MGFCSSEAMAVGGTFLLEDGRYSITAEEQGADLVVVEPNRRSVYAPAGHGSCPFHNGTTVPVFYLRVLDEDTLEAGRVPQSGSPSDLRRQETGAMIEALAAHDDSTTLADRCPAQAKSEPANAQAWSMCAAVAFNWAMGDEASAAQFAGQTAQLPQSILVGRGNRCPEAILPQYW